jgi:hypothetical protein
MQTVGASLSSPFPLAETLTETWPWSPEILCSDFWRLVHISDEPLVEPEKALLSSENLISND